MGCGGFCYSIRLTKMLRENESQDVFFGNLLDRNDEILYHITCGLIHMGQDQTSRPPCHKGYTSLPLTLDTFS